MTEETLESLESETSGPESQPDRIQSEGLREHGTPEQLAELYGALAKAQGDYDPVEQNREGQEGHRKFRYADLAAIHRATRPALSKHGLALTQFPGRRIGGASLVRTVLAHASGGRIVSTIEYMPADKIQDEGKQITYMRRYATNSVLGTAGDPDVDEVAGGSSKPERKQTPPPPPEQPKPKPSARASKPAQPQEPTPDASREQAEESAPAEESEPEPETKVVEEDGPPDKEQNQQIAQLMRQKRFTRERAMQFCQDVTGGPYTELTYAGAEKLIKALESLEA